LETTTNGGLVHTQCWLVGTKKTQWRKAGEPTPVGLGKGKASEWGRSICNPPWTGRCRKKPPHHKKNWEGWRNHPSLFLPSGTTLGRTMIPERKKTETNAVSNGESQQKKQKTTGGGGEHSRRREETSWIFSRT